MTAVFRFGLKKYGRRGIEHCCNHGITVGLLLRVAAVAMFEWID